MAYRRRSRIIRRKRPIRRRAYRRRFPRFSRMAETKKLIAGYTEQTVTTLPTPYYQDGAMQLNQGLTQCNRIGNWVNGVGFKTRFLLHNNGAEPQFVRYLMLVNLQGSSNTDYATGDNLFDNSSGTNTSLSTFGTNGYLVRRINKDKYKVLVDKVIRLGGSSDRDKIYVFNKYIRLKGRKYNFDATTAVRPTRNNIIELWLSGEGDDDVSTPLVVEITGEQCFYYQDP